MTKPHSSACDRNRGPILEVLREHFADRRRVLEIGSGTGQHAVHFADALPQLIWQTSDTEQNLPGIREWIADAALPNAPAPVLLDVNAQWPLEGFDAVFSANTLHIMSWPEVQKIFARVRELRAADLKVAVYGPFNEGGRFTSDSNRAFDQWLKARGEHMGIRDLEAVDALAADAQLKRVADVAMPANNRLLVWRNAR